MHWKLIIGTFLSGVFLVAGVFSYKNWKVRTLFTTVGILALLFTFFDSWDAAEQLNQVNQLTTQVPYTVFYSSINNPTANNKFLSEFNLGINPRINPVGISLRIKNSFEGICALEEQQWLPNKQRSKDWPWFGKINCITDHKISSSTANFDIRIER